MHAQRSQSNLRNGSCTQPYSMEARRPAYASTQRLSTRLRWWCVKAGGVISTRGTSTQPCLCPRRLLFLAKNGRDQVRSSTSLMNEYKGRELKPSHPLPSLPRPSTYPVTHRRAHCNFNYFSLTDTPMASWSSN